MYKQANNGKLHYSSEVFDDFIITGLIEVIDSFIFDLIVKYKLSRTNKN